MFDLCDIRQFVYLTVDICVLPQRKGKLSKFVACRVRQIKILYWSLDAD